MLRSLNLLPVYDSSDHDLVKDLIVPLLCHTKDYFCGVGFFSSGWLRTAAKGLVELVENGGKAHIVLSPLLEKSDWEAFQLGEQARADDLLKYILERNIKDLANALEKDTLNALAWMIADGVLEFRFAIPRESAFGGDYHDKVGVFLDDQGNAVAIHGSFNDTAKGSLNGEAFSVFKSWEEGQIPYVQRHRDRLTSLWERGNNQFRIYSIPEAVRGMFVKLRSTDTPPYSLPSNHFPLLQAPMTPQCPFKLYPFQDKAIKSWISVDCRGIFEMATGTGKTFTSLAAAISRIESLGRLALIILVPYLHLLEQWQRVCEKFGFSPILCSSEHGKWHIEVQSKIQDFNLKVLKSICIVAVHQTAASDRFMKATQRLRPENTMIIGDEVHSLGSPKLLRALLPQAGMRLGLSATPRRWFDDEGTRSLFAYFGEICFEFPLEEAIGQYLTPYDYYPVLVNLSFQEMSEYEALTKVITSLVSKGEKDLEAKERLEKLVIERARIISSAEQKLPKLLNILKEKKEKAEEIGNEIRDTLIYCAPGTHREILLAVSNLGLRCHEFVHSVSLADREIILDQFAKGDIQVLIAIKCLDEGVDVPSTKSAFFLASTGNPREFVQRRGRVLRLADGKSIAQVYDFVVVSSPELVPLRREIDAGLLKREMPRFAEFSSASANEFEARAVIRDLLDHYGMLHLLDERPWDIYHKMMENIESIVSRSEPWLK